MSTTALNKSGISMRVYQDADELALKAARYFARLADQYVIGSGHFTVAFSGGSTPKAMFTLLAAEPFLETIPWSSIYLFQVDERCVPVDHQDSNYRMMQETLLSKTPVKAENIFRIPAEKPDHDEAAEEYSNTLRMFFLTGPGATKTGTAPLAQLPRFDLIFLGMGADGHTASLFPGTAALNAGEKIAVTNYVEKLGAHRITLTAATINNARNVTFVAAGADKAATLKEVIEGPHRPDTFPSQLIRPGNGSLFWMVDQAAAAQLKK